MHFQDIDEIFVICIGKVEKQTNKTFTIDLKFFLYTLHTFHNSQVSRIKKLILNSEDTIRISICKGVADQSIIAKIIKMVLHDRDSYLHSNYFHRTDSLLLAKGLVRFFPERAVTKLLYSQLRV